MIACFQETNGCQHQSQYNTLSFTQDVAWVGQILIYIAVHPFNPLPFPEWQSKNLLRRIFVDQCSPRKSSQFQNLYFVWAQTLSCFHLYLNCSQSCLVWPNMTYLLFFAITVNLLALTSTRQTLHSTQNRAFYLQSTAKCKCSCHPHMAVILTQLYVHVDYLKK